MMTFTFMYAVLIAVALAVAILWIFLPFAVFGTKDVLRELVQETRRTNQLLAAMAKQDAVPTLSDTVQHEGLG